MPAGTTDVFWQPDTLLVPRFPLAVLVHGAALAARLLAAVKPVVTLGTLLVRCDRSLAAVLGEGYTLLITPAAAV